MVCGPDGLRELGVIRFGGGCDRCIQRTQGEWRGGWEAGLVCIACRGVVMYHIQDISREEGFDAFSS